MDDTPILALPLIQPSQAQKHVTHNEALRRLDALVQIAVADRDQSAPPGLSTEGARYLVAGAGGGDWADHGGEIALWSDGAWSFYAPQPGWLVWVADEEVLLAWDGASWLAVGGARQPLFGINTDADATNRLAVKSDALLFSHDDVTPGSGDTRLVMNKAGPGQTVAALFQSNWSGRAEIGLAGSDDLAVKVSPDGSAWTTALSIDRSTGHVGLGTASPSVPLDVAGPVRLGQYSVATLPAASLGAGTMVFVSDEIGGPTLAVSDGSTWRRSSDGAAVSA